MRSREAQIENGNHKSDDIIDLAHEMPIHINVWMGISYISVHICASFQSASSLRALKESVYDPVKIWLLFFQHIPDSLGRTSKLLLKSVIEVGYAVVSNRRRYLLHRHIALL